MYCYDPTARGNDSPVVCFLDVDPLAFDDAAAGEARERAAVTWVNYVFGLSWDRCAEARWTNVTKTARRLIFVLRPLGTALDCVRESLGLEGDDALEEALEARIREDRQDESSRRKLTLLRTGKFFSDELSQAKLAIYVVTTTIVDDLIYLLLGHEKKGITVLDLIDPDTSPLGNAGSCLVELLDDWRPESPGWVLLRCLGVEFADPQVMDFARQQVLGIRSGLLDYFELRLSQPPYTIAAAHRYPALLDSVCEATRARPLLCLPLSCQRWRARFPSREQFRVEAPKRAVQLCGNMYPHIAASELNHAKMRQDLLATGKSRSFKGSADRTLCKQVKCEHLVRGGWDPVTAHRARRTAATSASGDAAQSICDAMPAAKARKRAPGTFIAYQASKARAFKAVTSPDTPLSLEDREHMAKMVKQGWEKVKAGSTKSICTSLLRSGPQRISANLGR